MKKLLFILLLLPFFGTAQTIGHFRYDTTKFYKVGGNTTVQIENSTKNLTNSFLQNYGEGRTRFAYALDSVWISGDSIKFRYGLNTLSFEKGGSVTASEGLTKYGNDIQFGGPIGTPGVITDNRVMDIAKDKSIIYTKNYTAISTDGNPATIYAVIIDSMNSNNPASSVLKTAGTSFNRTLRVTGNYGANYKVGHALTLGYELGDTARIVSNGGDFGGALYNKLSFGYLPSFTTGRSAIRGGVVSYESAYAGISIIEFASSNANRHMKYNGWVAAHNAVLRMTNFPDTVENFIFYNAHSFKEASAKVLRSYGLYMNGVPSDSAWSVYSPLAANRFYHTGKAVFGFGGYSSNYQLKVQGTGYFSDTLSTGYTLADSDSSTAVPNTAWVKRNVGSGGGTPGIDDVLAQAQALTAGREINIGSHPLQINGSDSRFSELRQLGMYGVGMQDPITFNDASTFMHINDSTSYIAFSATNLNTGSGQANLSLTAKYGESRLLMEADSVVVRPAKMKIVTIADSADYYITLQPKDQSVDYKAVAYAHWPVPGGGGGGGGIDTIYRKPGQDSIFYKKGGNEYAIKDSSGGGGSYTQKWTHNLLTASNPTVAASSTMYFADAPVQWHTSAVYEIVVLEDCKLTGALVRGRASTAGSGEGWPLYVRVNNTTDYEIETVADAANIRIWDNSSLNVDLNAGDVLTIKSVTPAFSSAPATLIFTGFLRFEKVITP